MLEVESVGHPDGQLSNKMDASKTTTNKMKFWYFPHEESYINTMLRLYYSKKLKVLC